MAFSIPASRFDAPIIRWFAPPVLPSRESTRRAHALWMLAWPSFVVLAVLLSISIAASPDKLVRRATTIVVVGALTALLHEVSRRGRTEAASWMLVIGCTAILTQRAWGVGGIHAQVSMFYVLFVLMAGGLLGARGSVVTAFACLASAALLTAAAVAGWITAPVGAGSLVTAYLRVVLAIGLSLVIVNLLARQAQRAATEDLVQMFVHDMRSPLTVLVSRLSMLRDDAREGHLGEVTKGVDEAMVDVRTLNRLANDVLDISRLEMGRMPINLAPTDLGRVVHHVVGSLGAVEPTRLIEVRATEPVTCRCDPELLRRIIENLVSNAMKHTSSGGKISVDVSATGGGARIAVQDEGPGVPAEARDRIFERFSAPALRTESGYHSVGLGLAFCNLAVEAHGGTIRVVDGNPRGSVFVVDLPDR